MLFFLIIIKLFIYTNAQICDQNTLQQSYVTYCGPRCEPLFDNLRDGDNPNDEINSQDKVVHVVSSRDGKRFQINTYDSMDTRNHYYAESRVNSSLFVDTKTMYQRVLGFGTTITDASCINFKNLPENRQQDLIKEYFSIRNGLSFNLIKVPFGSTKFSPYNYALDSGGGQEVDLSAYDSDYRIPLIKEAMKVAGLNRNRIKIIASSESAPAHMKETNSLTSGGRLDPASGYTSYASYLLKCIKQYKTSDINIWALILSVSPASILEMEQQPGERSNLNYNSMSMTPSDIRKLVEAMVDIKRRDSSLSNEVKLLMLGDRKEYMPWWTDALFKYSDISDNIVGVAYTNSHDVVTPYDNLIYSMRKHPRKYFLVSEPAINRPVKLGNWQYSENYINEIVKNFEYGSVAWIDANMALDVNGGPTISDEHRADSPIIVDVSKQTFYRNPMFYAIGHLSRYVKPGSVRVKCTLYSAPLAYLTQQIAFITPDNYLVIFIANNNIEPMAIEIGYDTRTKAQVLLDTKSFNTFVMKLFI